MAEKVMTHREYLAKQSKSALLKAAAVALFVVTDQMFQPNIFIPNAAALQGADYALGSYALLQTTLFLDYGIQALRA